MKDENTLIVKVEYLPFITNINRHELISIGNHMISIAIWDKSALVNFSKTNKIARGRRASAICSLWKNLSQIARENHVITC